MAMYRIKPDELLRYMGEWGGQAGRCARLLVFLLLYKLPFLKRQNENKMCVWRYNREKLGRKRCIFVWCVGSGREAQQHWFLLFFLCIRHDSDPLWAAAVAAGVAVLFVSFCVFVLCFVPSQGGVVFSEGFPFQVVLIAGAQSSRSLLHVVGVSGRGGWCSAMIGLQGNWRDI